MQRHNLFFIRVAVVFITIALLLPVQVAALEKPLILSIHPYLSATEIYKRFGTLADYLGRELGRPVQIKIGSTYESHVEAIGRGEADIAFMGPAPYVRLTRRYGRIPLLAAFETNGSRTYRGVIVVRRDSPISSLAELRGKKVGFGTPPSTMSNLVPRSMLLKAGIELKHLGKAEFLSNHENIALGVLSGSFDAGALKEDIYNEYALQGLRALAISEPMPDHLFVARAGLPDDLVRRISGMLISLRETEDGRRILSSIQKTLTALVPARDADYDPLRKLLAYVEKTGSKP